MNRKDAGFTLIEALIVLAVVAITVTVALPGFAGVIERNRTTTALHLLSADMAMARATAITRRTQTVVCPRAGDRCAPGSDWTAGWLVFLDPDGDRQPNAAEEILRTTDSPASGRLFLPSSRPLLRYQIDGRSAGANLTVNVCSQQRLSGKVIVNNLGRVRTERPTRELPCPR